MLLRRDGRRRRSAGEKLAGSEVGDGGGQTDRQAEQTRGVGAAAGMLAIRTYHTRGLACAFGHLARWRAAARGRGTGTVHFVNLPAQAAMPRQLSAGTRRGEIAVGRRRLPRK